MFLCNFHCIYIIHVCFASSVVAGIITGAVIFGLLFIFLPIITPVCAVCCIKFGICGSSWIQRPATRVVTTAAPPPVVVVSTTTTTMSRLTGMWHEWYKTTVYNIIIHIVYYACSCTIVHGEICVAASCGRGSTNNIISIDKQQTYTTVGLHRTWWGHCVKSTIIGAYNNQPFFSELITRPIPHLCVW